MVVGCFFVVFLMYLMFGFSMSPLWISINYLQMVYYSMGSNIVMPENYVRFLGYLRVVNFGFVPDWLFPTDRQDVDVERLRRVGLDALFINNFLPVLVFLITSLLSMFWSRWCYGFVRNTQRSLFDVSSRT